MRRRRRGGVRGGGGNDVGDRAGPVVRRPYEVYFRKDRHTLDRGEVLFSEQSAATGRWSVHVDDRIGSAVRDAFHRGGHGRLPGGECGLQPGDRGWGTVRSVSGGGGGGRQQHM